VKSTKIEAMKRNVIGLLCLLVLTSAVYGQETSEAADGQELVSEGIESFEAGNYQQALSTFREVLFEPGFSGEHDDAYFWIARSALALNRLEEAAENLEFFISAYPEHPRFAEAHYLRGRVLYLQADYAQAIRAFEDFIQRFPESPFIANAYYWTGEAVLALGRLDQAERLFLTVIRDFPRSFRVEAAQYRVNIIELRRREEELLQLLRWSHEEAIRSADEFRRRERELEEAVSSLQERLAESGRSRDASEEEESPELSRLRARIEELESELAQAREEDGAGEQSATVEVNETRAEALELKEALLDELLRRQGGQ
jgi:TolA-binding protein